jgi:hypothetical protein
MARFFFPTVILLILLQAGCAAPPYPMASPKAPVADSPPPAPDYVPKKAYDLEFSAAWEGALQALREMNMPLALQDREKGILRTDYIKGPDIQRLPTALSTRYKYNLFFFKDSERRTILNVRCLYEIKEKSAPSHRDASDLYPDEVIALEKDLYRLIESSLLPLEASKRAGPRGGEKAKIPASPAPSAAASGAVPPSEAPKEKGAIIFPPPSAAAVPAAPRPKETPVPPPAAPREIQAASPPPAAFPAKGAAPGAPRPEPGAKAIFPRPKIFLVTKVNANLREEPSPQSKIILTLKPGRKVEKIGESGNWVQIKIWGTTIGWLQKELLQETPP